MCLNCQSIHLTIYRHTHDFSCLLLVLAYIHRDGLSNIIQMSFSTPILILILLNSCLYLPVLCYPYNALTDHCSLLLPSLFFFSSLFFSYLSFSSLHIPASHHLLYLTCTHSYLPTYSCLYLPM